MNSLNNNMNKQQEYNLRNRPVTRPQFLRFLNERNFPHLAHTFSQLSVENFSNNDDPEDQDYTPVEPISHPPSPNPSDVSLISLPHDLNEVDLFGLEAPTPESTPEFTPESTPDSTPLITPNLEAAPSSALNTLSITHRRTPLPGPSKPHYVSRGPAVKLKKIRKLQSAITPEPHNDNLNRDEDQLARQHSEARVHLGMAQLQTGHDRLSSHPGVRPPAPRRRRSRKTRRDRRTD